MKAYYVYLKDETELGIDIVFAKDSNQAIKKVFEREGVFNNIETLGTQNDDFIRLRAHRYPVLDNCEDLRPFDIAY